MAVVVDVVLLPPDEVMEKVIQANATLDRDKVTLTKTTCLPHISLGFFRVTQNNIPFLEQALAAIAKQFPPLELEIDGVWNAKKVPLTGFSIKKTPALQELHETVMNAFTHFPPQGINEHMFATRDVDERIVTAIEASPQRAFKNYHAHITTGHGELQRVESVPFTASRLGLCHVGNWATCQTLIFSTELKALP